MFACQRLNPKSVISDIALEMTTAKVFKDGRAALLGSKSASVWGVLPGLDATQVLLGQKLHFL